MTEYNLFCYAKEYNDKDSFQQKRYRVFNREVGKERYVELLILIKNNILKDFKLELNKNSWEDEWNKLSEDQIKRLKEIPEFDSDVFMGITEIDISDKKEIIIVNGIKYRKINE